MNNFAILDITQYLTMDGILIYLPTNIPCHLTCYWTDIKPRKHHASRTIRGKTVPWGVYFCFIGWHAVEQLEPGDTLYHTFLLSPWPICQTRWFTLRGTVDEVLSPSVGPIFEKHYPGPPTAQKFESYEDPRDGESAIYEPRRAAQTFTPTQPHLLTKVYTFLRRAVNTYPNLYIEIKHAPNDNPIEPILATGQTSWALIPTAPASAWIETVITPCILHPNTKYAIIARTAGLGAGVLYWSYKWEGAYPRGIRLWSDDAGLTWSKFPVQDLLFQEWGNPPYKGES